MKTPVAILGATGSVGQHFLSLLADHPDFEIVRLFASRPRPHLAAGSWVASLPPPADLERLPVETMTVEAVRASGARAVFSALPASVAGTIERTLVDAGIAVFSNASSHRMDADVPILIPEANAPHLDVCPKGRAPLVANSNCSASGLVVVLAALAPLGIRAVHVATYQSVSGAGYPGVPAIDIMGNVLPYIGKEDEKIVAETRKMLGTFDGARIVEHPMEVVACACRVHTAFGHLESVFIEVETPGDAAQAVALLREFRGHEAAWNLHSSPRHPIHVFDDPARPQPKKDATLGGGMVVSVGTVKRAGNTISLRLLVNNVVRGAAGGSVQNAELALAAGRL
ncbi:MAG: aspartate-semialdehyde dehydrogenase [Deltaproteobacteria bacterium HGW-Deltaproteobacteria-22]|jgi:aspartate-semialdehyde dehydrogenase|nr:MAG: aspartate-semialdehyde dehydrogenase [Deltaproteobacteria bacterium HGW-Deltaproteobacteria-22]